MSDYDRTRFSHVEAVPAKVSACLLALCAAAAFSAWALDKPSPCRLKFVEYIESNADRLAYIDTGYVPNAQTEIEVDFAFTRTNLDVKTYVFGTYSNNGGRFQFSYGPDPLGCFLGYGSTYTNSFRGLPYDTERHVLKYVPGQDKGFYFDGERVVPPNTVLTNWSGTSQKMYLGALHGTGSLNTNYIAPLRIYSCKIWEGGALVRNFMPAQAYVQTNVSVAVLYDAIQRKIHSNANVDNKGEKGSFIASAEEVVVPTDYRAASYIEANRTAYINTEYVPNANTELKMDFAFINTLTNKPYVFGSYGSGNQGRFMMSYGPQSTGCFIGYGANYTNSFVLPYNTDRHVVQYVPGAGKGFYFDGERVAPPGVNLTTWKGTGTDLLLGQVNRNGGDLNPTNCAPIRIYSCKIWETNTMAHTLTLVRDLVPKQRVFDGKNGLYDRVTGNFYAYYGDEEDFTASVIPEGVIFIVY